MIDINLFLYNYTDLILEMQSVTLNINVKKLKTWEELREGIITRKYSTKQLICIWRQENRI